MLNLSKIIADQLLKRQFVQKAIEDQADLEIFKIRPNARIFFGLFLIAFSYVIGWPAVGVLGAVSIYAGEPLIIAIGGPIVYGFSHLVFLCGMYFAGKDYANAFSRWLIRVVVEKLNS